MIAATSNTELNRLVHAEADALNMLVNVADVPELCNFILPAIYRHGPLAIAISTAGASPALAQRMKHEAADTFDEAYARLAAVLQQLRPWAKANLPTYADRKRFFDGIVNGRSRPGRVDQGSPVGGVRFTRREGARSGAELAGERLLTARLSRKVRFVPKKVSGRTFALS